MAIRGSALSPARERLVLALPAVVLVLVAGGVTVKRAPSAVGTPQTAALGTPLSGPCTPSPVSPHVAVPPGAAAPARRELFAAGRPPCPPLPTEGCTGTPRCRAPRPR